jgi:hypothetical protein
VNDSGKPGAGFLATVVLASAVAAPLLYIASAGAAAFLVGKHVIEHETYEYLYEPLLYAENHIPDWGRERIDDFITWAYRLGGGFRAPRYCVVPCESIPGSSMTKEPEEPAEPE